MNAAERHNQLGRDFVTMAGTKTRSESELMVVVESTLLASMQLLTKLYGVKPATASALMEVALQNATERFSTPTP